MSSGMLYLLSPSIEDSAIVVVAEGNIWHEPGRSVGGSFSRDGSTSSG